MSVSLPLFDKVTRGEALAAFGADGSAQRFCDDEFVKTEGAVLVFATLEGDDGTRLAYADSIEWCGRDLPAAVRDAFDGNRQRVFHHFVLVRRPSDGDRWLYCGRAHLGSWGSPRDGLIRAAFSFEEGRLSAADWQALGSRESWEINLKGETRVLAADDDAGFAAWLADNVQNELLDIWMTAPSGSTLVFFVNATRAAVFFMEGMAEPFSLVLRDAAETSAAEEAFFESLGPAAFTRERRSTVPRAAGLEAATLAFRRLLMPAKGTAFDLTGVRVCWYSI